MFLILIIILIIKCDLILNKNDTFDDIFEKSFDIIRELKSISSESYKDLDNYRDVTETAIYIEDYELRNLMEGFFSFPDKYCYVVHLKWDLKIALYENHTKECSIDLLYYKSKIKLLEIKSELRQYPFPMEGNIFRDDFIRIFMKKEEYIEIILNAWDLTEHNKTAFIVDEYFWIRKSFIQEFERFFVIKL